MESRCEGDRAQDRQLWAAQQQGSWEVGVDPASPETDRTVCLDGRPIVDYPPSDVALADLLAYIRGEGRYAMLGEGISTYPGHDANHERIYRACCELEQRGLIRRHREEPGHVLFVPTRCECGAFYKRASGILVCERCTLTARQEQRARWIAQTELVTARHTAALTTLASIAWQPIPLLDRDRLWMEARQRTEQEIARTYGVPAALLGESSSHPPHRACLLHCGREAREGSMFCDVDDPRFIQGTRSADIDLSRHSVAEIEAVLDRVLPLEEPS